jgi:hypothetical protein
MKQKVKQQTNNVYAQNMHNMYAYIVHLGHILTQYMMVRLILLHTYSYIYS